MIQNMEQDMQALRRDWERVGSYLSTAMNDVATELGGEALATRVNEAAVSDEVLPNPAALKLLESLYPGSAEQVMTRSEAIQQESYERERAALKKPSLRQYGHAMLEGYASMFGIPLQRH